MNANSNLPNVYRLEVWHFSYSKQLQGKTAISIITVIDICTNMFTSLLGKDMCIRNLNLLVNKIINKIPLTTLPYCYGVACLRDALHALFYSSSRPFLEFSRVFFRSISCCGIHSSRSAVDWYYWVLWTSACPCSPGYVIRLNVMVTNKNKRKRSFLWLFYL